MSHLSERIKRIFCASGLHKIVNFEMEDGSIIHFEFQSKNGGISDLYELLEVIERGAV